MPLGHAEDAGFVRAAVGADIEDRMLGPVGQCLDLARFQAFRAGSDRPVLTARRAAFGALAFVGLRELAGILHGHRLSVQLQPSADHLDRVARQADHALDVILPGCRMAEDGHVATLGLVAENPGVVAVEEPADILGVDVDAEPLDADRRARGIGIAVGHLVDEEEVADQQRVLHRAGGDPERLKEQGAEDARDQERPEDRLDRFPDRVKKAAFARHVGMPLLKPSALHGRGGARCQAKARPACGKGPSTRPRSAP